VRFGPLPLAEAGGAVLAHAVGTPGGTLRKGTRVTPEILARLEAAGVDSVIAARLDPGDVHEDAAAARLAAALAGPNVRVEDPATGRANLFAATGGLFAVDVAAVDAVNRLDPAITVATRPPLRGVEAGRMIATVKIIPFAVPEDLIARAEAVARAHAGAIAVEPYRPLAVAVISTLLPTLKPSVVDKTLKVIAERIAPAGARIVADLRVPHDEDAVAAALRDTVGRCDLAVVFGASAVVDDADVIPAGVRAAGGEVVHLGMPVDPGNLLILGDLGGRPVLGAPGCARSPRENGFDFVLERILAGRTVTASDIAGMGVGGLLMDIVSRPEPRTGEARNENPDAPRVAAVVLAAGRSTRFGGPNKLLADYGGEPMVRRAVRAAVESGAAETVVVTGHMAEAVEAALAGLPVRFVRNPDFAEGQSTSVRAGVSAVSETCEAAVVLLGDMPRVDAALVDKVIAAYRPAAGALVVVPTDEGRRGNPVLWSRRFFRDLAALTGDTGARQLISANPEAVVTVDCGPAVRIDVDTPDALATVPHG
jgi:molybdenum cofactor cytidylyltransferase